MKAMNKDPDMMEEYDFNKVSRVKITKTNFN